MGGHGISGSLQLTLSGRVFFGCVFCSGMARGWLRDFTVLKTMLTAVVAGGIGLYILKAIAPTLALPPRRKGRSTRCSASRGGAYGYFSKTILATATDGRTGNGSYKRHATMA